MNRYDIECSKWCHQTFKTQALKNHHEGQLHSTTPPSFVCTLDGCKKVFNRKDSLKHEKGHTQECVRNT